MSLYTKYRPKTLNDLVGQRHIIDILLAQAKQQQVGHSYLLFGPRGTGKTSTARLLAKIVNCTTFTADGEMDLANDPAAQLIDTNQTLDFIEIDAASHTGVDNIREEIIGKAVYPPSHLKKKVYVIDEVHMLSTGAFNALLKIMEEPPPYLIFILATTLLHKVPDTIISRCQVFNFRLLTIEEIQTRLQHIADIEQIKTQPEALRLIAKLSGGALRDAIKYLEQVSILGEVTEERVATFLGVVSDRVLAMCMDHLLGGDPVVWVHFLEGLIDAGTDLTNLAKEILIWLDEHFLENPQMYATLAGVFREIISESKRYPSPLLLRKAKTRHRFGERGHTLPDEIPAISSVKTSVDTPKENVITGTPIVSVDPNTPTDTTQLLEQIIARTTNPMLKSALKQYVMVDELSEKMLSLIVINEQYYHSLSTHEYTGEIEQKLEETLGRQIELRRTHMTKEQRLAKQMQH